MEWVFGFFLIPPLIGLIIKGFELKQGVVGNSEKYDLDDFLDDINDDIDDIMFNPAFKVLDMNVWHRDDDIWSNEI